MYLKLSGNLRALACISIFALISNCVFAVECQTLGYSSNIKTSTKALPKFEIATIKPVRQSNYSPIGLYVLPEGRIRIGQATLRMIIQYAYNVHDYQIAGGPSWAAQDLFEVQAIPPNDSSSHQYHPKYINNSSTEEQRLMLQSLLSERFGLKIRHESKMLSGASLVASKKTPQLIVSKEKHAWPSFNPGGASNGQGMSGVGVSMPYMASQLSRYLDFPVVDKTRLIGEYDFHLPEPPKGELPKNVLQVQDSFQKNIYDSLPDLGLKLKSEKVPVDILVIQEVNKLGQN